MKAIKQKAHAFTIAAACCLILSIPAFFGLVSAKPEARVVCIAALATELLLIAAATYFWIREKPQQIPPPTAA